MEEVIEAAILPETVWQAWERAHAKNGEEGLVSGVRSKTTSANAKGFSYQILDVVPGMRFSILWKTLFVRLIFTHTVLPAPRGSEIRYSVRISGFFAWPVRFFLKNKIRNNLRFVLKEFVKQLKS